jgi:DNA-binding response OmpR family regulator
MIGCARRKPTSAMQRQSWSERGQSMKVLYLEDSEDTRTIATLALRLHGHEVEPFSDAPAAIKALQEGLRVDVIVLDWVLPTYSGNWFLDECNTKGLARSAPVIVLTGHAKLAKGVEAAAVLLKPINMDELVMTLKEVTAPLGSNRQGGER